MLSLKFIRENIDIVKKSTSAKNIEFDIDLLLKDDEKRRDIIQNVEKLKAERNIINKEISQKKDVESNIDNMRKLSSDIKAYDKDLNKLLDSINNRLLYIPNIID